MSRCFPYPPPGFEPPVDLLNKEKNKEKKHKKDREKREKHRDKDRKDKKEKHKHKKRDKERDKDREKSKEKDKTKPPEKTLEDSRFVDELANRVGNGSQPGPATQFTEKRDNKPASLPVPIPSTQKNNHHGTDFAEKREKKSVPAPVTSSQKNNHHITDFSEQREKKSLPAPVPSSQKNNHHGTDFTEQREKKPVPAPVLSTQKNNHPITDFAEQREKKPVPVPVLSSQKNNHHGTDFAEQREKKPVPVPVLSSQKNNHHGTDFAEKREKKPVPVPVQNSVPLVQRKSDEVAKLGPTSHTNSNHRATNFTPEKRFGYVSQEEGINAKRPVPNPTNPNLQRKSNGSTTQVNNNNNHERKVMLNETKKPVPVPVPNSLNSLQAKTNGTTSQREYNGGKKIANNSAVPHIERKIGVNNHLRGSEDKKVLEREKVGLNLRGSEQVAVGKEEEKKEKKEKRKETSEEKELRRAEKRRRKEREKEEKKQRKKEREKEKEREKLKAVNLEGGSQRNIEKVRSVGEISNKRKEVESNGFSHDDDARAQKLMRIEPQKKIDNFTNGFLHENDAGPAKLNNKKLPVYPPPQNGRTTSNENHHPSPSPIKPIINNTPPISKSSNNTPPISKSSNNTPPISKITNNTPPISKIANNTLNKGPQLPNGTVPDAKGEVVISSKKKHEEPKPHRDLKYLHVVYNVPKLKDDDLTPEFDNQEWLFSTKPKPNPSLTRVEPSQVWDRAVRIDSDGSFALPYVIPF